MNNKILIGFCALTLFLIVCIPFGASSLIENGYLKNPSDFNNVASGIQSIVLAASVFIGGVWSWWKASEYMEQHKLSRSRAEHELLKLKSRPNIEVELSCSQFFNFGDSGLYIRGVVKLKNNGNFPAFIKYDFPIYITKLELSPEGEKKVAQHYREEVITAPSSDPLKKDGNYGLQCLRDQILDPNSETSTNFIKRVRDPGLYLVEYRVPVDVERQCALEDVGENMILPRVYSNREYISIQYKGDDVKG